MFGIYALGLITGLLLAGPLSDARGRRKVVIPAAGLSLVAILMLVAGAHIVALLFARRLTAGLSSGAVAAGTAWLCETSLPLVGTVNRDKAVRRAVIAMTAGFGLGPLVAGMLAQWVRTPHDVSLRSRCQVTAFLTSGDMFRACGTGWPANHRFREFSTG